MNVSTTPYVVNQPASYVITFSNLVVPFHSIFPSGNQRTSTLNASASYARLFPAASHDLEMLDLLSRFRRFRYKDRLFEYYSITSRDAFHRRGRACLTETSFTRKLQIMWRRLTHAFGIDRLRSFRLSRIHRGTKHARLAAGYFCVAALVDGRISPRISRVRKKHTHLGWRTATQYASSGTLTNRELFASHANWS